MTPQQRAQAGFVAAFGHAPDGIEFAPGRVNLMGDHVDYNDGLVLPMPLTAGTAIAWSRGNDAMIEAIALDLDGARDRFDPADIGHGADGDWRDYLRGMSAEMVRAGLPIAPARMAIAGSIPRGSGLSSSASLCIAVGRALGAAAAHAAEPRPLALAAQAAEHNWAGVNCGIMDQMVVAAGTPGSALLLDCRDLTARDVALPADWSVLIVQSGVVRGLVDGQYNARRSDCETAVRALGGKSLRDATAAQIGAAELDPVVRRRALHVSEEIGRTAAAVAALEARDLVCLGALMRASHASLRDQFEVSVGAVDALADLLNQAIGSAGGARMTGGGFGGAVVAVLATAALPRALAALEAGYVPPGGTPLSIIIEPGGRVAAGVAE